MEENKIQISGEIIKILDYIGEKFGLAVDWTSVNIMPYFTELCGKIIKYEICTSIAWLIIFIVAIVLSIIFIRKCIQWAEDECEGELYWFVIILVIAVIAFGIGVFVQIFDIIECAVFPEKHLVEYFTKVLNSQLFH